MTGLLEKFDECFKREFPATFEAAKRGEPKPHGDYSNAWWGFREGYRCALPTTEPERPKYRHTLAHFGALVILTLMAVSFFAGYQFPRGLELESTKPIVLTYEITPEAQRALMLRSVEGFPKCEAENAR